MLAIVFYLGSDRLRRYALKQFETTFSSGSQHRTGRRLVLYDASGDFDRHFEWWSAPGGLVLPELPMNDGRTDVLVGSASRIDIRNINLVASLLLHCERDGYWKGIGELFEQDLEDLLDRHLLSGLLDAPWVFTSEPVFDHDAEFFAALQELVAYAFEEAVRVRERRGFFRRFRDIPARPSNGILQEVQALLHKYREAIVTGSSLRPGLRAAS
jgi:hypothetical protein